MSEARNRLEEDVREIKTALAELIRKLVEARWRDLVLRGYRMGAQGGTAADVMRATRDASRAFSEQTEALAAQLPPEQERAFLAGCGKSHVAERFVGL